MRRAIRSYRMRRRALLRLGLASSSTLCLALLSQSQRPSEERLSSPPPTIPRPRWGAREPNLQAAAEHGIFDPQTNPDGWQVYAAPLREVLTTIIVHHSGLPLSDGPREIQQLHMDLRGYADIAYHYVVDDQGLAYEGRDLRVRGAHTAGFNTGTVGIVLLGNFEERSPTKAQLESLTSLALSLVRSYGITHLAGHRDFLPGETVCPGGALAAWLPGFAVEAGLQLGTRGYRPPAYKQP